MQYSISGMIGYAIRATDGDLENVDEFDPSKGVNRDYEANLHDHYGGPMHHH